MDLNDDLNERKGRKRGQENTQPISNEMEAMENRNKMFRGSNNNTDIMGNFSLIHQGGDLLHHMGNTHPAEVQYEDDDSEDDDVHGHNNNFNSAVAVNLNHHNMYDSQLLMQQQQQMQIQQQQQLSRPMRKSRRKPPGEICGRTRWTEEMDAKLRHAYDMYGNQWREVAMCVGFDKNSSQCHKRWTWYINPALETRVKGPWADEEIEQLRNLVEQHGTKMTGRGIKEAINWTIISKELNREYYDCKNKYKLLQAMDMKKGPFTEHEDNVIAERVIEWANRGNGLWVMLEKELNRRSDSIKSRAIKNKLIVK